MSSSDDDNEHEKNADGQEDNDTVSLSVKIAPRGEFVSRFPKEWTRYAIDKRATWERLRPLKVITTVSVPTSALTVKSSRWLQDYQSAPTLRSTKVMMPPVTSPITSDEPSAFGFMWPDVVGCLLLEYVGHEYRVFDCLIRDCRWVRPVIVQSLYSCTQLLPLPSFPEYPRLQHVHLVGSGYRYRQLVALSWDLCQLARRPLKSLCLGWTQPPLHRFLNKTDLNAHLWEDMNRLCTWRSCLVSLEHRACTGVLMPATFFVNSAHTFPALEHLHASFDAAMSTLAWRHLLPRLQSLQISTSVNSLFGLVVSNDRLHTLALLRYDAVSDDTRLLAQLPHLTSLSLPTLRHRIDTPASAFTRLVSLKLVAYTYLLDTFQSCRRLKIGHFPSYNRSFSMMLDNPWSVLNLNAFSQANGLNGLRVDKLVKLQLTTYNSDLSFLRDAQHLTYLSLNAWNQTDVSPIGHCVSLVHLALPHLLHGDLGSWKTLRELQVLRLSHFKDTDTFVRTLPMWPKLRSCALGIESGDISALGRCKDLASLRIRRYGGDASALTSCPLRVLLANRLTTKLKSGLQCAQLTRLSLDAYGHELPSMPGSLTTLNDLVWGIVCSDAALSRLDLYTRLTQLQLPKCVWKPDRSV